MLWRNFYWIFLLLSATGISLYHWTLDAPDTFSFNSLWPQFSISPSLLCHILLHASVNNCKSFAVQRLFFCQLWTFIAIQFPANSRYICFVPSQITSTPSFLISCPSSLPPPDVNARVMAISSVSWSLRSGSWHTDTQECEDKKRCVLLRPNLFCAENYVSRLGILQSHAHGLAFCLD